jgi:hypothetical protein
MATPQALHLAPAPRRGRQHTEHVFREFVKFFGRSLWGAMRESVSARGEGWATFLEGGAVPQNFIFPSTHPDTSVALERS